MIKNIFSKGPVFSGSVMMAQILKQLYFDKGLEQKCIITKGSTVRLETLEMNKESPWYGESWIVLYADDIHFYSPENL